MLNDSIKKVITLSNLLYHFIKNKIKLLICFMLKIMQHADHDLE